MCKAWKEEFEYGERNGLILGTIETLRDLSFVDDEIKEKIMAKYNLTEKEAKEYMLKKSA